MNPQSSNSPLTPRSANGNSTATVLWSVALAGLVVFVLYWLGGSKSAETTKTSTSPESKSSSPSSTTSPANSSSANNPTASPSNPPFVPDPENAARQAREEEQRRVDAENRLASLKARLTQPQARPIYHSRSRCSLAIV
jgi:type IV secretory pathway VirB10-like protein